MARENPSQRRDVMAAQCGRRIGVVVDNRRCTQELALAVSSPSRGAFQCLFGQDHVDAQIVDGG